MAIIFTYYSNLLILEVLHFLQKRVMSEISYDLIFVFFSRSYFTGRLGILDLPEVPSDSLKGVLGCPHAFSYLIIAHVIHLFNLHLLKQLLCLVEFERIAYDNELIYKLLQELIKNSQALIHYLLFRLYLSGCEIIDSS